MSRTELRCLIVESEPPEAREQKRESVGRTSAQIYADVLESLAPCACDEARASDGRLGLPDGAALEGYDAVLMTGSPLHLYQETPDTRRQVAFMRAVFASGTPSFGSCAGLQVATVAAGGAVRPNTSGREVAVARRITPTEAGRAHPLLHGRPGAYDALAIHADEVETLPPGARLLATNRVTAVQAAEIRWEGGTFWGVQYHPELSPFEMAAALRRQGDALVAEGFAADRPEIEAQAALMEALDAAPGRRDLLWRLGLDEQVTDADQRRCELRNFIERLVRPVRSERGRG